MYTKICIFIFCLLLTSEGAFAVRGDGSRIQNFRNSRGYNGNTVTIQNFGYPNYYTPYINGSSFNPNDAYSYRDRKGNLIYYTTDLSGNTVYFQYGADGQIVHVDPREHPP